jgi:hypothetical protein
MPTTIEQMHKAGMFIEKTFYPGKKNRSSELRGVFRDIGKMLKKEGRTSVDLIRDLRKT